MATQLHLASMEPAIIPVCFYCHQPASKIVKAREELIARYPEMYPSGMEQAREACVCCTPDSDYLCPQCKSEDLRFAMVDDYTSEGTDSVEMAECRACGWQGEARDAAPPVEPWAELEAVRAAQEAQPMGVSVERGYADAVYHRAA